MKKLIILTALTLLLGGSIHAQVQWKTIEEAAAMDSTNKKLFFIDFSTSWCSYCKKMDRETFQDPVIYTILNRYYVPVQFDAEGESTFVWDGRTYIPAPERRDDGGKNMHSFTYRILGNNAKYPSIAFFNKDQRLKQILEGYQSAYDLQIILWYFCSGDFLSYAFYKYQEIFDEQIKPVMMKNLDIRFE